MAGPTTVKQLEELLATPNGLRDHLASVMSEVYEDAINPLVRSQVSAAVEKALADQAKAYDTKLENLLRGAGVKRLPMAGAAYNPHAPGASLTGEFKGLNEFLVCLSRMGRGQGADARLKAFAEADGGSGGVLVPEEFRATLMALELEEALIRPRATVIPMGAEVVKIPAIRDTSHASSVFGGVVAYWTPEAGTLADSDPTFTQIALTARKLTGYTIASNELLADSAIALEALILNLFPRAIAWYEEKAFFSGSGAGEPVGFLNADCAISVSKEANQAATTIVAENLDNMFARMLPSSRNRAIWIANPNVFPQLAQMSRSVGTGGAPVWV
ncbi:MAG: phage major capsid protein, partial [Candidatus Latescibacterota bacterium]